MRYDDLLAEREGRHIDEIVELLRIPSVSALPAHREDMVRAAEWLAERLRRLGVPEVDLLDGDVAPVVWGRWIVDPGAPVALVYGHYDVQPADPFDLWRTPPFEPETRDGALYARGAADDKGTTMVAIQAIEALCSAHGQPPLNLAFFIEGEEEIGSPSAESIVARERERLACDVVISADGVMFSPDRPSLTLSTKGMLKGEIHLRTAAADQHSGLVGNAIANAVQVLAKLLSTFHSDHGAVVVQGFHDGARPISPEERAETEAVPFDQAAFLEAAGATALWGDPAYSPYERMWLRPTIDFNGVWGGFQGEGTKTVTPCEAHAKFTCRLVAGQEPLRVLDAIRAHVARHCPPWAKAVVTGGGGSSAAFEIRRDHPVLSAAAEVMTELAGVAPYRIRLGGTLPIAEIFQRQLRADMVFYAWEMPDNNLHAPNEFARLSDYRTGRRAWCDLLTRLPGQPLK
jgi:acetylornithine deacetylase/succinyl-diaminopimelate desuccinylase-like protein